MYLKQLFLNRNMDFFGLTQKFSSLIIRPPRVSYSLSELGPQIFQVKNQIYRRIDFRVRNHRGFNIECSIFKQKNVQEVRPIVIFLHANSSSRLTVKTHLREILPNFDVVGFDFAGSGLSEGRFTTLGYEQKQDLHAVIQYMRFKFKVKTIVLWGRSMGAVTAILYTAKYCRDQNNIFNNPEKSQKINQPISKDYNNYLIKALVLDSPFSNLTNLIKEFGNKYLPIVPNFVITSLTNYIQNYIKENVWEMDRTNFELGKLNPLQNMKRIPSEIPVFFLATKNDQLVNCQHTFDLYECCNTTKQIEIVDGGHNDNRPDHVKKSILQFMCSAAKIIKQKRYTNKISDQSFLDFKKQIYKKDNKIGLKKYFIKNDKEFFNPNNKKYKDLSNQITQQINNQLLKKETHQEHTQPCSLSEVRVQNMSSSFKNLRHIQTQRSLKISRIPSTQPNQHNLIQPHQRITQFNHHQIHSERSNGKCPTFLLNKNKQLIHNTSTQYFHRDNREQLKQLKEKKSIVMVESENKFKSSQPLYNNNQILHKQRIRTEIKQIPGSFQKVKNLTASMRFNLNQISQKKSLRWSHKLISKNDPNNLAFKRMSRKIYHQPQSFDKIEGGQQIQHQYHFAI